MDQKRAHANLIDRFARGEAVDISGLSQPTRERLIAERARKEMQRAAFDAQQAEQAAQRERDLHTRFVAAGGSDADWQRERATLLAEDRRRQVLDGADNGAGSRNLFLG